MAVNSDDARRQARQTTVSLLITNPNVSQMLAQDNTKPKFKDLMISWLEELGWPDADRYFEPLPEQNQQSGQPGQPGQPNPLGQIAQQMQQGAPQPQGQGSPQGDGGPMAPTKPSEQGGMVTPPGYFNFSPPNSLMGIPAYIQQRYAAQRGTAGAYGGVNPVQGIPTVMGV